MKVLLGVIVFLSMILDSQTVRADACNEQIAQVKSMILEDGTVLHEREFLKASDVALKSCAKEAEGWPAVKSTLRTGRKACNEAARQGQSQMFRGYCYLKASEFASFVLGK